MADSVQDLVASTVAEVDRLFRNGKFQQSNALIDSLLETVPPTSYLLYCRGRNLRYLGDLDAAARSLDEALTLLPTFNWTFFELAAVALYRGEFPQAARHALTFVTTLDAEAAAGASAIHKDVLLKSAHGSFAVDRPGTAKLYERLAEFGIRDYLSELRLAETMADRGQPQAAHERLQELDQRRGLDPWGGLIWVRVLRALGRVKEARQKAEQVLAKSPPESVLRVNACQRLLDLGAVELVAPHVAEMQKLLATHPAHPVRDLRFRYACVAGGAELAALRTDLLDEPEQLRRLSDGTLVDAIFALTKYGNAPEPTKADVAGIVVKHLQSRARTPGIVLASLHHLQFLGQFQEASILLAGVSDPAILAHPDIALRRFEIFCRTNRLDEALLLYREQICKRRLSGWESAFVLRFLAEMAMDGEAVTLIENLLLSGQDLPRDDYLVLQVIRRAGGHRRIFDALHDRLAQGSTPEMRELQRLLVDDLCLAQGTGHFHAFGQDWDASAANAMLVRPRDALGTAPADGCAFLCTNRAYFFSALTFFASCAAHSPRTAARFDWYMFLDDNVPPEWEAALHQVAHAGGLVVRVVREPDFVANNVDHMESYGIFTGGIKLSRAAYFRIYAGLYLYQLGAYPVACYFDTDIICRGELAPMLDADFGEDLILARLEDVNDDVIAASKRSGADPYKYFNSGVLAMNFRQPDLVTHLEQAVFLSEREPERLTFHDQCALNIAFKGRAGLLDSRLNHFLRPNKPDSVNGIEKALMLHYLDRPKPWDVTFRLSTRHFWEAHAREVRAVVDADLFRQIVAASNGLVLSQI